MRVESESIWVLFTCMPLHLCVWSVHSSGRTFRSMLLSGFFYTLLAFRSSSMFCPFKSPYTHLMQCDDDDREKNKLREEEEMKSFFDQSRAEPEMGVTLRHFSRTSFSSLTHACSNIKKDFILSHCAHAEFSYMRELLERTLTHCHSHNWNLYHVTFCSVNGIKTRFYTYDTIKSTQCFFSTSRMDDIALWNLFRSV